MNENELWELFVKEYKKFYDAVRVDEPTLNHFDIFSSSFKPVWDKTSVDTHNELFDIIEVIAGDTYDFLLICRYNTSRWDLFTEDMWSAICEWNKCYTSLRVLYV